MCSSREKKEIYSEPQCLCQLFSSSILVITHGRLKFIKQEIANLEVYIH